MRTEYDCSYEFNKKCSWNFTDDDDWTEYIIEQPIDYVMVR